MSYIEITLEISKATISLYFRLKNLEGETISKLSTLVKMTRTNAPDAAQHLQLLTELDALTLAPMSQV